MRKINVTSTGWVLDDPANMRCYYATFTKHGDRLMFTVICDCGPGARPYSLVVGAITQGDESSYTPDEHEAKKALTATLNVHNIKVKGFND